MKRIVLGVALVMVALIALPATAKADTVITLNNTNGCGGSNCFGNAITFTIHPTGGNNYVVTMAINTTGNTNAGTAIVGVDFKFGTGITSASLASGPTVAASWNTGVFNSLNSANGCATAVSTGFGCSEDANFQSFNVTQSASLSPPTFPTALAPLPNSGTYTWQWNVTANGSVFGNQVHVGVLFGNINTGNPFGPPSNRRITYSFQSNGLISSVATPIPEPGTLALLGTGLLGLAGILRRRLS